VGTNRYSYSFNDPVNLSDPSGNGLPAAVLGWEAVKWGGAALIGAFGLNQAIQEARRDDKQSNTTVFDDPQNAEENPSGLSSGHPGLDAIFGGFDGSKGRAGQSYPGTLEELNEDLKGYAEGIPGAEHGPTGNGGYQVELPDGTKISTYPGRSKSGTDKPGFQVTKPGQRARNGIKGTVEGTSDKDSDTDDEESNQDQSSDDDEGG
jgi:hypothetical protein